ncbi:MAG: putative toxin-antitoxin system toxin component, PIN family [Candidatus Saccharimonadales bacterium]
MRIVYDTNVIAPILLRRGEILKLKHRVKYDNVTVITSEFILDELAEVLRLRLGMTKQRAKANSRAFIKIAQVVKPTIVEPVTRDPDDDYVLATAVTGKANYLVTLDEDLLVLKVYKGIRIIKPSELDK